MASLVLGGIGKAVGGPLGGIVGGMLGSLIDSHLFKPKTTYGPQLTDLSVTSATYGQPVPLVYGTTRISGNLIDATSLVQHSQTVGGGKGGLMGGGQGGAQVTYSYTGTFAVGICAGPITKIWRIWADGQVLCDFRPASVRYADLAPMTTWNLAAGWTDFITIYLGTEDQLPDPSLESIHGVGNVPAYRGLAYIACSNMPLTSFGNRVPNFSFEIVGKVTTSPSLTYDDNFLSKNTYFSGAGTTAQADAPCSVDQYGNFILTDTSGTSAAIAQNGTTVWSKTSSALAADLIAAAYPGFANSVNFAGMVAVANGQYLLGFASSADSVRNQTRFFLGVYTPSQTGPPEFKGAIVIGSGIYSTGWPYTATPFGWTVAGAQTTSDPILAISNQGLGGTSYYIGVMPCIGNIIGGTQEAQNAQNANLGLPATQGLIALYGPITTYLPQEGAFTVPYLTEATDFIFSSSQPIPVSGTQMVFLFTKSEIASNAVAVHPCPLITTWAGCPA